MKQGCNFQEVCMLTASHCDSRLVRSVSSPWSTNHHRIWLEFAGFAGFALHPEAGLQCTEPLNNISHSTTFNLPPDSACTFNSCPVTLSNAITSCTIVRDSTRSTWCGVRRSSWTVVHRVGLLPYICYSSLSLGWPGLTVSSCSSSIQLRNDSCRLGSLVLEVRELAVRARVSKPLQCSWVQQFVPGCVLGHR